MAIPDPVQNFSAAKPRTAENPGTLSCAHVPTRLVQTLLQVDEPPPGRGVRSRVAPTRVVGQGALWLTPLPELLVSSSLPPGPTCG